MQFDRESKVTHPAALILDTMINRMQETVPFLPNVESIELKERTDLPDGRIKIIRRWQGSSDTVPSVLAPFLSRETLAWTDTALWIPQEYRVEWSLSTSMGKFYDCSGNNFFEPDPADPQKATRIRISGTLTVYPERLPGMPSFLGRRLAPQVEKFIVNLITPNLMDVASGLQKYLDQPARA